MALTEDTGWRGRAGSFAPKDVPNEKEHRMGTVAIDITVSLDGFATGPNAGMDGALGIGGEPLHDWVHDRRTDVDAAILDRADTASGALLMGRHTFDVVDGPKGWSDEPGPPVFVVTSNPPTSTRLGDRFRFVGDLEDALTRAKAAAGDKDVMVMGGAHLCRQYLYAGLVDEVRLHVAPIVLGDGTPLFERTTMTPIGLVQQDVTVTPAATHITYRVNG
ncbi:dihydrofolate reductase family protein [Actinophytocola oryzae]|uniref:dihydrofolate reductase family protein n=1 Tax=Actinophytocola oryzae TaxID=502181 RepID=UPI001FB8A842|nr:dihydrofolate reductase family protein [Actinophytocola oryzae]